MTCIHLLTPDNWELSLELVLVLLYELNGQLSPYDWSDLEIGSKLDSGHGPGWLPCLKGLLYFSLLHLYIKALSLE